MNKIPQKWKTLKVKRLDNNTIYNCYIDKYDRKTMQDTQTGQNYSFCLDHIRNEKFYKLLEVQRGEKQTFYLYDDKQKENAKAYKNKLFSKYKNILVSIERETISDYNH